MSLVVVTTLIDILGLLALGVVCKLLLFMGFFFTCVGVFLFFHGTCVCVCVLVCAVFSCDVLYFYTRQGNGICLLVVGSPSWKRVQLLN